MLFRCFWFDILLWANVLISVHVQIDVLITMKQANGRTSLEINLNKTERTDDNSNRKKMVQETPNMPYMNVYVEENTTMTHRPLAQVYWFDLLDFFSRGTKCLFDAKLWWTFLQVFFAVQCSCSNIKARWSHGRSLTFAVCFLYHCVLKSSIFHSNIKDSMPLRWTREKKKERGTESGIV